MSEHAAPDFVPKGVGPETLGDPPSSAPPALSFIQPWLSGGILRFGKRVENRLGWRACKYGGAVWVDAPDALEPGWARLQ